MIQIGDSLPAFSLQLHTGETLADVLGQWTVLYFYPKDNTPGCTTEALDFTALAPEFQSSNCRVIGVSPDSIQSHCNFIQKKSLDLLLLADPDHTLTEACGFWQLKKFMGREFMGVVRSTLLIDPQGQVRALWSPVKVKDHAQAVLNELKKIQNP
jgi:peroxiredoxin Q/BCP